MIFYTERDSLSFIKLGVFIKTRPYSGTNTSNLTYNGLIVVPTNSKRIRVLSILRTYESFLYARIAGRDKVKSHAQISIEFNQIKNFVYA